MVMAVSDSDDETAEEGSGLFAGVCLSAVLLVFLTAISGPDVPAVGFAAAVAPATLGLWEHDRRSVRRDRRETPTADVEAPGGRSD